MTMQRVIHLPGLQLYRVSEAEIAEIEKPRPDAPQTFAVGSWKLTTPPLPAGEPTVSVLRLNDPGRALLAVDADAFAGYIRDTVRLNPHYFLPQAARDDSNVNIPRYAGRRDAFIREALELAKLFYSPTEK